MGVGKGRLQCSVHRRMMLVPSGLAKGFIYGSWLSDVVLFSLGEPWCLCKRFKSVVVDVELIWLACSNFRF